MKLRRFLGIVVFLSLENLKLETLWFTLHPIL